ncbi:MAG: hypothetical protein HQ536_05305 [Parcubacteria group bacterium]|nr:hypothetical protein [Parcubacteria group bacterium]
MEDSVIRVDYDTPLVEQISSLELTFINDRVLQAVTEEQNENKKGIQEISVLPYNFDHHISTVTAGIFLEERGLCVLGIYELVAFIEQVDSVGSIIAPKSRYNMQTQENKVVKFFPIYFSDNGNWKGLDTWDRRIGFPPTISILVSHVNK